MTETPLGPLFTLYSQVWFELFGILTISFIIDQRQIVMAEAKLNNFVFTWPAVCTVQLITT